ncbi:MAG: hypothetical protein KatS3mg053_2332 [Candidatus Roseilinea sp.]|nr:MAG: hypothetical protein KatS3mg053_2332 [Candidatus Roseilinea sp.]
MLQLVNPLSYEFSEFIAESLPRLKAAFVSQVILRWDSDITSLASGNFIQILLDPATNLTGLFWIVT